MKLTGKHAWRSGAAVFVMALCFVSPAWAIDLGDWAPGLKFGPFISERIEYESNVFLAPNRVKDDVTSRTIPGFLLDYNARPLSLTTGYRLEVLRFFDLTKQDSEHHFVVGQLKLELSKFTALVREDLIDTTDPPGTELTGRIRSTTNTLAPEAEYKVTDRLSAGANYGFTHVNFENRVKQLNRDEDLFGGSLFWKILPKTDLRLSYTYGEKTFVASNRERNVTRNIGLVGLRGDLTSRLSSTFRIGFESREPRRRSLPDFNGLVVGGDWTYRPTDRTRIMLLTDRSVQESATGSAVAGGNGLFFVSTIGTLQLEHKFVPKLTGSLRLSEGDNAYPSRARTVGGQFRFRDDNLASWGGGLEYTIQPWLRVGGDYSHTRRDSNFQQFNYKDDKVGARVTLEF